MLIHPKIQTTYQKGWVQRRRGLQPMWRPPSLQDQHRELPLLGQPRRHDGPGAAGPDHDKVELGVVGDGHAGHLRQEQVRHVAHVDEEVHAGDEEEKDELGGEVEDLVEEVAAEDVHYVAGVTWLVQDIPEFFIKLILIFFPEKFAKCYCFYGTFHIKLTQPRIVKIPTFGPLPVPAHSCLDFHQWLSYITR